MGENLKLSDSDFEVWYSEPCSLLGEMTPNYFTRDIKIENLSYHEEMFNRINNLIDSENSLTDEKINNLKRYLMLYNYEYTNWSKATLRTTDKNEKSSTVGKDLKNRYLCNGYGLFYDDYNEMEISGCLTYHHEKNSCRHWMQIYDFTTEFWNLLRFLTIIPKTEIDALCSTVFTPKYNMSKCNNISSEFNKYIFSKLWLHNYGSTKESSLRDFSELNIAFDMDLHSYFRGHRSGRISIHGESSKTVCARNNSDGLSMDIVFRSRILSLAQYFLESIYDVFVHDTNLKSVAKVTALGNSRLILLSDNVELPSFDIYNGNKFITTISPVKLDLNKFEQIDYIMNGGW